MAATQPWRPTIHTLHALLLGTVLLTGVAGTLYGRQSLTWERAALDVASEEDVVYLPGPTALRASSLGHLGFAADLVFIRAHAYFLRHLQSDRILRWLDTYVDAIIALDPAYADAYQWASSVIRLGQEIDEAVIAKSNHYAELGVAQFPDDPRFYEMLGFNKYFELRPRLRTKEAVLSDAFGKANSKDKPALLQELTAVRSQRYELERSALEDMTIAAMLPGSTVDALFLVNLYVRQDDVGIAKRLTKALVADARAEVRAQLLERLEDMGDEAAAAELRAADEARKAAMPFISEDLFALVGSSSDLRVPAEWNSLGRAIDDALGSLEARQTQDVEK